VTDRSHAWVWHVVILAHVVAGLVAVAVIALPGSSHHRRLQLGLDLGGGVQVVLKAVPPPGHRLTPEDVDRSLRVMRNRIDKLGVSGPELRKQGTDAIVIQLPGVHDPATAAALIGKTAQLEIYDLEPNRLAGPARSVRALLRGRPLPPDTIVLHCGASEPVCPDVAGAPRRTWFYLFRHNASVPEMRGTDLDFSDTGSGYDDHTHRYFVDFGLKREGARKLGSLTRIEAERGRARGSIQHAAFVLDNEITPSRASSSAASRTGSRARPAPRSAACARPRRRTTSRWCCRPVRSRSRSARSSARRSPRRSAGTRSTAQCERRCTR
jgi:preprotein translocase subunit SecD